MSQHPAASRKPETSDPEAITPTWLSTYLYRRNPVWLARYLAFRRRIKQLARSQRRWLLRRAAVSLGGAALLLALGSALASPTATISVAAGEVEINDNDKCSLIEAIHNANDTVDGRPYDDCKAGDPDGADTIRLPNDATFTLSNGFVEVYDSDTGLPLISSDITIDGSGSIIEREETAPRFRLLAVGETGDLVLKDTTLRGGYSEEHGGGIFSRGELTVESSTITGSSAEENGGGIANRNKLTLSKATIDGNDAEDGGGVYSNYVFGWTALNDSTVSGNMADGSGGGLYIGGPGHELNITNSTVENNVAGIPYTGLPSGGGIFIGAGNLAIMENSVVRGNTSDSGAGIRITSSQMTVRNSSIIANLGRGISSAGPGATVDVIDTSVTDNTEGGISNAGPDATVELINTSVTDNTARSGAGISNSRGTIILKGASITGNRSERNGAGISSFEGAVTINESIVDNNRADAGGGIYSEKGMLSIVDSTIDSNMGYTRGGGIHSSDATMTVSGSTISRNVGGLGGGIFSRDGILSVSDSILTENTAYSDGGGIYGALRSEITIANSFLDENNAFERGGSIGGGGEIVLIESTVEDSSSYRGGGIYWMGQLQVADSTISGNEASYGGGVNIGDYAEAVFTNCTLSENTATNEGGAINQSGLSSRVNLNNCTIANNSAGDAGGGIFARQSTTIAHSLVSGNSARLGAELYWDRDLTNPLVLDNHNILGHNLLTNATAFFNFSPGATDLVATSDGENIPLDAILDTTLANNGGPTFTHALVPDSQAIDFVPSAACDADPINGTDQRGEPRNVDIPSVGDDGNKLCDAGAVERQLVPPPTATATATNEPTVTVMPTIPPTATATKTPVPSATPTVTAQPTATAVPSATPTTPVVEWLIQLPVVMGD